MEADLSATALVNAGGAFLFLLVGLGILFLSRGRLTGVLLGGTAVFFGMAFIVENLVPFDPSRHDFGAFAAWGYAATTVPAAGLAAGLAWTIAKKGGRASTRLFAIFSALMVACVLAYFFIKSTQDLTAANRLFNLGSLPIRASFLLLVATVGVRLGSSSTGSWSQARGWALVALAFGIWTTANVAANITTDASQGDASGFAYAAPLLALFALFPAARRGEPALRRRLFLALIATTLFGLASAVIGLELGTTDSPIYGIARAIGAVLLVLAVIRGDVLQVPLPRIAVRRGAVTTGALAVLFIVAQVAQNFFSAKYGLLMGGVLAGTFVFAASPIQRAIERSSDHPKPNAAAASGSAIAGYKAALRAAMRDGTLNRREERHLAEVAMALGIGPVQALDLRDEVERENV